VNRESLHYFAAMTFDRFYTQLEASRDLSRAVALCHHSQHLDLSRRELFERPTQLHRFGDRSSEAAEIVFHYQVFCAAPDAGHGCFAIEDARHENERGRGPDAVKECQRGLSVERPEGMVGKDHVGRKIVEDKAAAAGTQSFRVFGDTWQMRRKASAQRFAEYEAAYDQFIVMRYPVVTVCAYDVRRFSGVDVLDALKAHRDTFRYPLERALA
jgi:MEDS: MEthanogen/methylotroph, DcmR Sensory domain